MGERGDKANGRGEKVSDIADRLHAIVTQAVEEITRLRKQVAELDARAADKRRMDFLELHGITRDGMDEVMARKS